jgi:hypothetical protein
VKQYSQDELIMRRERQNVLNKRRNQQMLKELKSHGLQFTKILIIIALIATTSVAALLTYRWTGGGVLAYVKVEGATYLSTNELLQHLGVDYSTPIEKLSLDELNSRLKQLPGINPSRSYAQTKFPNGLILRIEELPVVATVGPQGNWIRSDGSLTRNLNPQKKIPQISCENNLQTRSLTNFLGRLRQADSVSFSDILGVHCLTDGRAEVQLFSIPMAVILDPRSDGIQALRRLKMLQAEYPDELKGYKRLDFSNKGYLFAS